jgi:ribonuclease R
MEVDRQGEVVRYEMHDGVIHSDARMTYTDVNAILTDRDPETMAKYEPLVPMFELMHELFEILNAGGGAAGRSTSTCRSRRSSSTTDGLVEAIIAPSATSRTAHRGVHAPRQRDGGRQHLESDGRAVALPHPRGAGPAEGRAVRGVRRHARLQPRRAARRREAAHFQKLVERMRGTPEEKPIAFLMLRTMQKARYDPSNLGHFGLAAGATRTSRRPSGGIPTSSCTARCASAPRRDDRTIGEGGARRGLPEIARHTSERERRADDAERELLQWKKVRFMADKVGDEFDGYVTGVAPSASSSSSSSTSSRGSCTSRRWPTTTTASSSARTLLRGENTGKVYRLGDKVRVQVVKVDMERRQVDLGLVRSWSACAQSERNRGPRRSSGAEPSRARAARAARRRTKWQARGRARSHGARGPQGTGPRRSANR